MSNSYIAIDRGSTKPARLALSARRTGGKYEFRGRRNAIGWAQHNVPVIMAGMVGSNAGWVPVSYLSCPTSLTDIAGKLTRVNDAAPWDIRIILGISIVRDNNCNVMRGEETQLLGAYRTHPASLYLMPHARHPL